MKYGDSENYPAFFCGSCGTDCVEPDESVEPTIYTDGIQTFLPMKHSPVDFRCLFRVAQCSTCGWWLAIENADQGIMGMQKPMQVSFARLKRTQIQSR